MQLKKLTQNYKRFIAYTLLGFFSYYINFYYGSLGLFPLDSLSHFDTGFRILLGEYPFKDYWVISGPIIDYFQAIFFYFFGVSWNSYLAHTSFFNLLLTLFTYYFFLELKINNFYSFFYALFFSVLAYTTSGTPFVDHHSTFISLIAVYLVVLNFEKNSKFFCIIIPILFFMAFFSKQVPSSYIILACSISILVNIFLEKKFEYIKYYIYGVLISLLIILTIGHLSGITLQNFLIQYIYYPQTMGSIRIDNLSFGFKNLFLDFKLIHFLLIILIGIFAINLLKKKNNYIDIDFYRVLTVILTVLSLIFHQLITYNQIFIFFFIPILAALLHIEIAKSNFNNTIFLLIIFIFTTFATQKYHFRFNEGRKFHELSGVDFSKSIDAKAIDSKLKNLKWITPFEEDPASEIDIIIKAKEYISNNKNNLMVITNYSFFSALSNKKLHSPIRWHVENGNSHPLLQNEYYSFYKNFLIKKINDKNINEIIIIGIDNPNYINNLLSNNCNIDKNIINPTLISHLLKNCVMVD